MTNGKGEPMVYDVDLTEEPKRRKFNHFEYYLNKITIHKRLLEAHPECIDCEHMGFWIFSPEYYRNHILPTYCTVCEKFNDLEAEISGSD